MRGIILVSIHRILPRYQVLCGDSLFHPHDNTWWTSQGLERLKPNCVQPQARFLITLPYTLYQTLDLSWYCIPEKWQIIQKHVEQKWIFSPGMKGKKSKRNILVDCKRFQSCKCFCYIALIWTVNKQFMGEIEYIKIYSWNSKKK